MTDQNKQNESLQAKATTLFSMLGQKFEMLEKLPQKQLPMRVMQTSFLSKDPNYFRSGLVSQRRLSEKSSEKQDNQLRL